MTTQVNGTLFTTESQAVFAPEGVTSPVNPLADYDRKLIENGYEPVAVEGKKPVAAAWTTGEVTANRIDEERCRYPFPKSTGLRTGRLVGVDIDLHHPEHAEKVRLLASEIFGETDMERVGAKGMMLCYRNSTPVPKITIRGDHPIDYEEVREEGKPVRMKRMVVQVEILGVGQQFVAYGIHPITRKPYTWPTHNAEPLVRPVSSLVEVTPDKLHEFAQRVAALLSELSRQPENGRWDVLFSWDEGYGGQACRENRRSRRMLRNRPHCASCRNRSSAAKRTGRGRSC